MAKDKVIPSNLVLCNEKFKYDNIEQMVNDTGLQLDNVVELLGYYKAGDGAGHQRIIASEDDGSGVQLGNGLWANIVHNGIVHSNWFGANKNGDVTDIFKKIVAYNKPAIIDYGSYELSKHVFVYENIIVENFGSYSNCNIIYSKELPKDNPKLTLIGSSHYVEYSGDYTYHQAIAYNKNNGYYYISFSKKDNSYLSSICVLDSGFNFVMKKEGFNNHGSFLCYNQTTNKLILNGGNGENDISVNNVLIINPETLEIEDTKTLKKYDNKDYTTVPYSERIYGIDWDSSNEIYMVLFGNSCIKFYDKDFTPLEQRDIELLTGWQEVAFFRGNIIHWTEEYVLDQTATMYSKDFLMLYNLKGERQHNYIYELGLHRECEGVNVLDDDTVLLTTYNNSSPTNIYFYEADFSKVDTEDPQIKYIYANGDLETNGDGSAIKPFNNLRDALNGIGRANNVHILLSGTFEDDGDIISLNEDVKYVNYLKITSRVWRAESDVTIKNRLDLLGCNIISIDNVNFEFERISNYSGIYLNVTSCSCDIRNLSISMTTPPTSITNYNQEKVLLCYNGKIHLQNIKVKNCYVPFHLRNGAVASIYYCNINGGNRRFVSASSSVIETQNSGDTTGYFEELLNNIKVGYSKDPTTVYDLTTLNTPYYTYKMEQEGVLQDYYSYLDEKYAYDAQVQVEEQAKYEAYELALQDNPKLTWEEFLISYPTTITSLQEPVIPETVQAFMDKYLGVKATQTKVDDSNAETLEINNDTTSPRTYFEKW